MSIKIKSNTRKLDQLTKELKKIHNKNVSFGYYQEQGTHYSGYSYPDLMSYLEYGDHAHDVPPRPVFSATSGKMRATSGREVRRYIENFVGGKMTASFTLDMVGAEYAKWTQDMFGVPSQVNVSNSPRTVSLKGGDTPLVDTGDLKQHLATKNSIDNQVKELL